MIDQAVNAAKQVAYQAGLSRRRFFGWLGMRALGEAAKAPRATVRLWLEPLEGRLCPSWTAPVNLGPPISTVCDEGYPVSLTNNGLSAFSRWAGYTTIALPVKNFPNSLVLRRIIFALRPSW